MDNNFKLDLVEIKNTIKCLDNKLGYIPKPEYSYSTQLSAGCGSGGCVASCSGGCAGGLYDSCFFS